MFARAGHDLFRIVLRLIVQLWPLWLFWFAWSLSSNLWLAWLQTFPNRSTSGYALAYRVWPSVALLGPVLLMLAAVLAYRTGLATRVMPIAGIVGVIVAAFLTAWPEYDRLVPYIGRASPVDILRALDLGVLQAVAVALLAALLGWGLAFQRFRAGTGPRLIRGRSDNFGHADWLAMRDARHLFPGPDEVFGGIVVGEAYRVSTRTASPAALLTRPARSPAIWPARSRISSRKFVLGSIRTVPDESRATPNFIERGTVAAAKTFWTARSSDRPVALRGDRRRAGRLRDQGRDRNRRVINQIAAGGGAIRGNTGSATVFFFGSFMLPRFRWVASRWGKPRARGIMVRATIWPDRM